MKTSHAAWLRWAACWLLCITSSASIAATPASGKPARKSHVTGRAKNHTVALLAGAVLHLTQNAQELQRASIRRREEVYGPHDPQVREGHRRLRVIHGKMTYFRRAKRRGEGHG